MKKLLAMLLTLVMALSVTTLSWADVTSEKAFPGDGGANDVVYWSVGEGENEHGFTTTLAAALTAAYKANKGAITIICKPGADVGTMTHGHVADDLTIYGNGARVSGGEYDLEVDTYKYSRTTGAQANDGAFLEKDITITVYDLNGVAIWGQRNTDCKVTASFYNCKNMNRAYISGGSGSNVLLFDGCSFDGSQGDSNAKNSSIYSNAAGSVTVKDTTFTGVAIPINLKNKSNGTQTVSVENCEFTDCATESVASAVRAGQYAAPIRVVADNANAKTELSVDGCTFNYTGDAKSVNGDILIGDGRANENPVNANVTISVKDTAAVVEIQEGNYYNGQGDKDVTKGTSQTVSTDDVVTGTGASFTVAPAQTEQPPRYYYNSTTTDTKADGTKGSPKTFDAGVGIYALTAVLSVTGMACVGKKKF